MVNPIVEGKVESVSRPILGESDSKDEDNAKEELNDKESVSDD